MTEEPAAALAPAALGVFRDAFAAVERFTMAGRYVNDVAGYGDDGVVRSVYGDAKNERRSR